MKRVLVFEHAAHETMGTLARYFSAAGVPTQTVQLFREQPAAFHWNTVAGLVVMGGYMNVDETEQFPFLAAEVAWIQEAMAAETPILGLCLGAQLLAKAAGSRVYPNGDKEVGWHEIELTPAAQRDPLFHDIASPQKVFQWHGDTFDLPVGATHLAQSRLCRHQAFRVGPSAYGLQFHAEMDELMIADWTNGAIARGEFKPSDPIDLAAIVRQTPDVLPKMQMFGDVFLPRFVAMCLAKA
jgi:GMP synthase-like glutamine amidotransferase